MRRTAVIALVHACFGIATAVVALGWIGVEALADRGRLVALALEDSTPIVVQDRLKFASALATVLLVAVWYRLLRRPAPRLVTVASVAGALSAMLLVGTGGASLAALGRLAEAGAVGARSTGPGAGLPGADPLEGLVALLAADALVTGGLWHLLINLAVLRAGIVPRPLAYLGVAAGGLGLLPPVSLPLLALSVVWSGWLGAWWLRGADQAR